MEDKAIRAAEKAYAFLVAVAQQSCIDVPGNLAAFSWKISALPGYEIFHLESVHLRDHAGKRKWLDDRGSGWTGRIADFAANALDHAAVFLLAEEAIRRDGKPIGCVVSWPGARQRERHGTKPYLIRS